MNKSLPCSKASMALKCSQLKSTFLSHLKPSIIWPYVPFCSSLPLLSWCTLYFPKHVLYFLTSCVWTFCSLHLELGIIFNFPPLPFSEIQFFFWYPAQIITFFPYWGLSFSSLSLETECLIYQVLNERTWNLTLTSFLRIRLAVFVFVLSPPLLRTPHILRSSSPAFQSFNSLYIISERKLFLWGSIHCLMTYPVAGFCNC